MNRSDSSIQVQATERARSSTGYGSAASTAAEPYPGARRSAAKALF